MQFWLHAGGGSKGDRRGGGGRHRRDWSFRGQGRGTGAWEEGKRLSRICAMERMRTKKGVKNSEGSKGRQEREK